MGYILASLTVALASIYAAIRHRHWVALEKRIKTLEQILIIEEYRCPDCTGRNTCTAANIRSLFPCEKFQREDL